MTQGTRVFLSAAVTKLAFDFILVVSGSDLGLCALNKPFFRDENHCSRWVANYTRGPPKNTWGFHSVHFASSFSQIAPKRT